MSLYLQTTSPLSFPSSFEVILSLYVCEDCYRMVLNLFQLSWAQLLISVTSKSCFPGCHDATFCRLQSGHVHLWFLSVYLGSLKGTKCWRCVDSPLESVLCFWHTLMWSENSEFWNLGVLESGVPWIKLGSLGNTPLRGFGREIYLHRHLGILNKLGSQGSFGIPVGKNLHKDYVLQSSSLFLCKIPSEK